MISLLRKKVPKVKIEEITIDVTLDENHSYTNEITSFEVEEGADMSDHIHPLPEEITIQGITSNTPVFITAYTTEGVFDREDLSNRGQVVYNKLLEYMGFPVQKPEGVIQRIVEPHELTLVTRYKSFSQMYISRINFPINKNTGDALPYSITLKKVRKGEVSTVTINNTKKDVAGVDNRGEAVVNKGKETTTDVPKDTLLFTIVEGVKTAIGK